MSIFKGITNKKDKAINDILDKHELTKEELERLYKLSVSKNVRRIEYTAVLMLIVGCIMACIGARFLDKMFKTYSLMNTSSIYKALENRDNENDTLSETHKLMDELENLYESSYIGEIERENIDEYVLNSLLQAYGDRYAVYMDPQESVENNDKMSGNIQGIGILARAEVEEGQDNYDIYVIDVYDDSPAEEAGLKIGDKIIEINNAKLDNSTYMYSEAINDIRGEAGTEVILKVIDADTKQVVVKTAERNKTTINTVRYQKVSDDIGYILIRQFENTTDEQLREALNYFESQGIHKYIFDMRDNPGGLKDAVVKSLDMLLPEGLIMHQLDSEGNIVSNDMSDAKHMDFESVTLTNISTASAAELFTQCLRDYNQTTIIGKRTFGKGTICTTFTLSNGGSVMMSTGKYLTKSGFDIEKNGIEPDIEMELDSKKEDVRYKLGIENDDLVTKAIEVLSNTQE